MVSESEEAGCQMQIRAALLGLERFEPAFLQDEGRICRWTRQFREITRT